MKKTLIALFRGINVGGNSLLPMEELRKILTELGAQDTLTYIQSGNVVFKIEEQRIDGLPEKISSAVQAVRGFTPRVLLLTPEELEATASQNPFREAEEEGSSLHLGFLSSSPQNVDMYRLNALKSPTERYFLSPRVFYLHAPDGVGKSKLAANVERILGVEMTDRNWKTVCKLREMLK